MAHLLPLNHSGSQRRYQANPRRAFTLLELLIVIGIISVLLVAVIPAVTSFSKSSGRKGAISNLLGAIEQARAEAIKTGQAAYIVFPTFTGGSPTTLERYNHKSYAVFADDSEHPGTPKQLTNWKTLPTGISLRAAGPFPLSDLVDSNSLTPPITVAFTPDPTSAGAASFRCIKFNANGEVESSATNVSLAIFEGHVNGTTEVITSGRRGAEPTATESITIARLTGRAERSTGRSPAP